MELFFEQSEVSSSIRAGQKQSIRRGACHVSVDPIWEVETGRRLAAQTPPGSVPHEESAFPSASYHELEDETDGRVW